VHNKLTGPGRHVWPDGRTYTGPPRRAAPPPPSSTARPRTQLPHTSRARRAGAFEDAARVGEGVIVCPAGTKYTASFERNEIVPGPGRIEWADGAVYQGAPHPCPTPPSCWSQPRPSPSGATH
jgi:hypothetical protein